MELDDLIKIMLLVAVLQVPTGLVIYAALTAGSGIDLLSVFSIILVLMTFSTGIAVALYLVTSRYSRERTLKVALMTLTTDERLVLEHVMRHGNVRQDDLRRQVDMSKAKLSALVNNLVQKKAINKTRFHKTNVLEPTKEFKR